MSAHIDTVEAPATQPSFLVAHRRALVIGSRTALLMLVIAALVILGLGAVALIRGGGPEVDGWLRAVFGRVFGVVAVAMAAILGIPAGIGMAAMAGATAGDAVPALGATTRRLISWVAIGTVVVTALAVVTGGSQVLLVNLGIAGLVALALLGLAGAVAFTPHRGRGIVSAVALLAVAAGTLWVILAIRV
jgi:hypothetical protein